MAKKKEHLLTVRCTTEEAELIRQLAEQHFMTTADYVRTVATLEAMPQQLSNLFGDLWVRPRAGVPAPHAQRLELLQAALKNLEASKRAIEHWESSLRPMLVAMEQRTGEVAAEAQAFLAWGNPLAIQGKVPIEREE